MREHAAHFVSLFTVHDGPPTDASPAALSRAIARGDDRAFETFYRMWFDRAAGIVSALTRRDEAFCLDVVQAAMLKAARRMPAMQTDREVEAWLGRVLRTTALDELRREKRRTNRERHAPHPEPAGASPERDELIAALHRELAGLASVDQDLVRHRIAGGATHDEAGAGVGLSGDAAHGRVRRALAVLRARLKGEEP